MPSARSAPGSQSSTRIGGSRSQEPFRVRIGIATGLVVVGDLIGAGGARAGVIGETPNLAARLQGLAAPDALSSPEATRESIGALVRERRYRQPSRSPGSEAPIARLARARREKGRKPLRGVTWSWDSSR